MIESIVLDFICLFLMSICLIILIIFFRADVWKTNYLNSEGVKKLDNYISMIVRFEKSIISFFSRVFVWWTNLDKIPEQTQPVINCEFTEIEEIFNTMLSDVFDKLTLDIKKTISTDYYAKYVFDVTFLKPTMEHYSDSNLKKIIISRIIIFCRKNYKKKCFVITPEFLNVSYYKDIGKLNIVIAHNPDCIDKLPIEQTNSNDEKLINIFEEEYDEL